MTLGMKKFSTTVMKFANSEMLVLVYLFPAVWRCLLKRWLFFVPLKVNVASLNLLTIYDDLHHLLQPPQHCNTQAEARAGAMERILCSLKF
jgi:hypothetical protein